MLSDNELEFLKSSLQSTTSFAILAIAEKVVIQLCTAGMSVEDAREFAVICAIVPFVDVDDARQQTGMEIIASQSDW